MVGDLMSRHRPEPRDRIADLQFRIRNRSNQRQHRFADNILRQMPITFHPDVDESPKRRQKAIRQMLHCRRVVTTKSIDQCGIVQNGLIFRIPESTPGVLRVLHRSETSEIIGSRFSPGGAVRCENSA